MVAHSTLTGADLHEPKGAETASANTTYIANGAGSGSWRKITLNDLNTANTFVNFYTLSAVILDISTPSTIIVPVPFDGELSFIATALGGTITTADSVVTLTQNGLATIDTITVDFATSAEGEGAVLTTSSNNTFSQGEFIKITTDGGSTGTTPYFITLVFERTA